MLNGQVMLVYGLLMVKQVLSSLVVLFLASNIYVLVNAQATEISPADGRCIGSFEAFVLRHLEDETIEKPASSPKWNAQAIVPSRGFQHDLYHEYGSLDVSFSRLINGDQEIWITGQSWTEDLKSEQIILIYKLSSQEWELISTDTENTDLYVDDLFVDSQGNVWGRVLQNKINQQFRLESFPILSRFNETMRQFEFIEGTPEVATFQKIDGVQDLGVFDPETRILLDNNDIFWILFPDDGLYQYDPVSQMNEKRLDHRDISIRYMTLAPDGSVYFSEARKVPVTSWREHYTMPQGILFQYFPETGDVVSLNDPDGVWPLYSGLLVDHRGRLWLGPAGYHELDGTWHLLALDVEDYLNSITDYNWILPEPIIEDSTGTIWFNKFLDMGGASAEGTAWYNPDTGEGCVFTRMPANIIEDSNQTLWMIVDNTLYALALDPR